MSAELLRKAATILRERAEAATPGPWERGDHWHIQGASHCPCRSQWGPANERMREINGKPMLSHAHRDDTRDWPHGINTVGLQADGFPHSVVVDTDEYGYMLDADADYIATMHPGVGLALADWLVSEAVQAEEGWAIGPNYPSMRLARLIVGEQP